MNGIKDCISCATISGSFLPPGGVIFETPVWLVVLRANPVRFPCLPLILLKRHEEDIACLNAEESSSLGEMMRLTAQALSRVVQPSRVHFGIYAEEVRHLHVHVFPRMPDMPAGNLANVWIGQWMEVLHRLGLKKAYPDEIVVQYSQRLRKAYQEFHHDGQNNPLNRDYKG